MTPRQTAWTVSSHVDRQGRREVTFAHNTAGRPGPGRTEKRSAGYGGKGAKKLRVASVPEDVFGFEPVIHHSSGS